VKATEEWDKNKTKSVSGGTTTDKKED